MRHAAFSRFLPLAAALLAAVPVARAQHRAPRGEADPVVLELRAPRGRAVVFVVEDAPDGPDLLLRAADGPFGRKVEVGPVRPGRLARVEVLAPRGARLGDRVSGEVRVLARDARSGRRVERRTEIVTFGPDRHDRGDDQGRPPWGDARDDDGWGRPDDRHRHRDRVRRPRGYETMAGVDRTLLDLDRPIRIDPGHDGARQATVRAMQLWNQAARAAGLGRLFVLAEGPYADVVFEWRNGLPGHRASWTSLDRNGHSWEIERVTFDPDLNLRSRKGVEVIAHELGHVLGLGDSSDPRDIMSEAVPRSRGVRPGPPEATDRDVAMLEWLHAERPIIRLVLAQSCGHDERHDHASDRDRDHYRDRDRHDGPNRFAGFGGFLGGLPFGGSR